MSKFQRLLDELERFRNYPRPEMDLADLEKTVFKELGVERVKYGKGRKKRGGGAAITYYHPVLESVREGGYMVVHKLHKKKDMIPVRWFRQYLYEPTKFIIEQLKLETDRDQ